MTNLTTLDQIEATPTDATSDIRIAIRNAKTTAAGIRWEDFFPFPPATPKAERIQKVAEIKADPAKRETVTARLADRFVKAENSYKSARRLRPSYTNRPTNSELADFQTMLESRAILDRWVAE